VSTDDWKRRFLGASMRTNFTLALTQPMLELLCAVADGVHWDRHLYFPALGQARSDHFMSSAAALIKRGLVETVPHELRTKSVGDRIESDFLRLTPAGEALVALLRVAGIFVEADATSIKKARSRRTGA
jgi:hypothetical protein